MNRQMKFSGDKENFESGATREAKKGRGLPALIYPGLMVRLSKWLEMGAENHEPRNWEQGIPSESYLNSLYRHVIDYHAGDRSEDHLAAMLFNVQGLMFNEEMIERGILPAELNDLPNYIKQEAPEVKGDDLSDANQKADDLLGIQDGPIKQQSKKPTSIVTFSGKKVNPLDPDSDTFDIFDIARALSRQCRFTGHTRDFYSVAQHSVLAASWARDDGCSTLECLAILIHDATEAYMNDVAKPIKQVLPDYLEIEQNLKNAIDSKYLGYLGVAYYPELKKIINKYDQKIMALEVHKLMPKSDAFEPWLCGDAALQPHELINKFLDRYCFDPTWTSDEAYDQFIANFDMLVTHSSK